MREKSNILKGIVSLMSTGKSISKSKKETKYWSKKVTETSHALALEPGVFTRTPKQIALSLKRSAEKSTQRKASPFRSAMSMLTFYQNRAGRLLTESQKNTLHQAKDELRKLYGHPLSDKTSKK